MITDRKTSGLDLIKNRRIIGAIFFFVLGCFIYFEWFSFVNDFIVGFWSSTPWREGTLRWRSGYTVTGWLFWLCSFSCLLFSTKIRFFFNKVVLNKVGFLLIFLSLFFVLRIPFYSTRMMAEDGLFANILINHPSKPNYCLVGRIDGKDILEPIQHPGLIYEPIAVLGDLSRIFVDFDSMDKKETTFIARLLYSFFNLAFWIFLIFYLMSNSKGRNYEKKDLLTLYILLLLSSLPIAINNGIDLQIDNSIGVFYNGIMGIAIFRLSRVKDKFSYPLIFFASVIVGFGKNEWGIILFMTIIAAFIYFLFLLVFRRTYDRTKEYLTFLGIMVVGLVIGSYINFMFDPVNYNAGIKLLTKMSGKASLWGTMNFEWWLHITKGRLPYIISNIILILSMVPFFIRSLWKGDFYKVFLYGYSLALFLAFFFSMYERTSRYYASSFIILVISFLIFISDSPIRGFKNFTIPLLVIFFLSYSLIYLADRISTLKHYKVIESFEKRRLRKIDRSVKGGCIPMKSSSDGFFHEGDFIAESLGRPAVEAMAARYGRKICR